MAPPSVVASGLVVALALSGCPGSEVGPSSAIRRGQASQKGSPPVADSSKVVGDPVAERTGWPVLADVAELLDFHFRYHSDTNTSRFFLPEVMGGGAAWLDYDGDGWQDLFVPNGCVLPDTGPDAEHTGRLFRNHGGSLFSDLTILARADDRGYGQGVCVGDYNNDGFPDLLVTHFGTNRLLRNNGDGTFSDSTAESSIHSTGWSTSCAFGDLNRDGDLDLIIAHYVQTGLDSIPFCEFPNSVGQKVRGYCGPDRYDGELSEVYCNLGNGEFREVTQEAGCAERDGKGLALVIADLNNDCWPDIYVANDMVRNFLFLNRSMQTQGAQTQLRFEECAMVSGTALTGSGRLGASMGIGCADYDHNGWLDLVVTNYLDQGINLYRNQDGKFLDYAAGANLLRPSLPYLGFGTGFFDYDNDGWMDLFVTNGHVLGPLAGPPDRMRGQVFRNLGNGRYQEVTDLAGPYFYQEFLGRGLALCDFGNEGATGLVVIHQDEPAALLRNDTANRGHYLGLQFVGTRSNRCGLNTRVLVTLNSVERVMETVGGGSYLSDSDHRLMIGLGQAQRVERIKVQWPSGAIDDWRDLPADRYYMLVEGGPLRLAAYDAVREHR